MTQPAAAYKNVANRLLDLADGRTLERGAERKLTLAEQQDPHNRQLIDAGLLVEAQHAPRKTTDKTREAD